MTLLLASLAVVASLAGAGTGPADSLTGAWRAVLDLAGGRLPFSLTIARQGTELSGRICNGPSCTELTGITSHADSVVLEMGDYAASITLVARSDSLIGTYRNVGNRGPRASNRFVGSALIRLGVTRDVCR